MQIPVVTLGGAVVTLGGPVVTLGGPVVTLGGPVVTLGGPVVTLGGPVVTLGGPVVTLGGPVVTLGGPVVTLGGPVVTLGGPVVTLGGPVVTLGGPVVTLGVGDTTAHVNEYQINFYNITHLFCSDQQKLTAQTNYQPILNNKQQQKNICTYESLGHPSILKNQMTANIKTQSFLSLFLFPLSFAKILFIAFLFQFMNVNNKKIQKTKEYVNVSGFISFFSFSFWAFMHTLLTLRCIDCY